MKSIHQIFEGNEHLMDLDPVSELLDYCYSLEDELVELRQNSKNKTVELKQILSEITDSCDDVIEDDNLHQRWPESHDKPDYKECIFKLKEYISEYCRKNYIYL